MPSTIGGVAQADAGRAWYEGEAGRRHAAQAAAESQRQAEQTQRKLHFQDLQAAAVLHQKEAQLLEHRSTLSKLKLLDHMPTCLVKESCPYAAA